MKSSNVANSYLLTVFLLLLLSVTACHKELEYPLGMSLPESDIVFMPDSDPTDFKENSKTLGFINSDGSKREEFTFFIAGSKSMFGIQFYHQYATDPRWAVLAT